MTFIEWLRSLMTPAPAPLLPATVPFPTPIPVQAVGDPDWPAILRAAGFADPELWAGHLALPAQRWEIRGGRRVAAFAATVGHESGGGTSLVESLNYRVDALTATWPSRFSAADAERMGRVEVGGRIVRTADQRAIAERAYGGRMGNGPEGSGDGWNYRGRGLIQVTGRDGYRQAGAATGLPLEQQPDLAAQPNCAAAVACWAWASWKGCNPIADAGDVEGWRRAINGGLTGLDDVQRRYEAALRVTG
ncbi:glycoside hydrolase family 19 protein [Roseomonas sp. HJA6]|uniref:Glycoside hydrolase family 19 protein n=1 Tax=Roseomonas alba TaxID=2846776 RepID=A0ABS7AHZ0_9PROT|nr:glycoside hydrolase family 19 protein [Neoroseomonas alba]MBW6400759.1 glycoside hydrolase family 19 protein [Neoroseomonas alba]